MISFRKFKNNLLKYFNSTSIDVYLLFDDALDTLEKVEVYSYSGYDFDKKVFKNDYVNDWEAYVDMKKYVFGCHDGTWVRIYSGTGMNDVILLKKYFYTK